LFQLVNIFALLLYCSLNDCDPFLLPLLFGLWGESILVAKSRHLSCGFKQGAGLIFRCLIEIIYRCCYRRPCAKLHNKKKLNLLLKLNKNVQGTVKAIRINFSLVAAFELPFLVVSFQTLNHLLHTNSLSYISSFSNTSSLFYNSFSSDFYYSSFYSNPSHLNHYHISA